MKQTKKAPDFTRESSLVLDEVLFRPSWSGILF